MDKGDGSGKIRISVTIDSDVYINFKEYCGANGMKVSSKVERLMSESVKNQSLRKFV